MKIVYNDCFGGFGLSETAYQRYAELAGFQLWCIEDFGIKHYFKEMPNGRDLNEMYKVEGASFYCLDLDRHDPILVQVVEELGNKANDKYSDLKIFETSSNQYRIEYYDGSESVQVPSSLDWITV